MFSITSRNPFFIYITKTNDFNQDINGDKNWSSEERCGVARWPQKSLWGSSRCLPVPFEMLWCHVYVTPPPALSQSQERNELLRGDDFGFFNGRLNKTKLKNKSPYHFHVVAKITTIPYCGGKWFRKAQKSKQMQFKSCLFIQVHKGQKKE